MGTTGNHGHLDRFRTPLKGVPRQRAFSLVELTTVLVILGILAAVAVPRLVSLTKPAYRARVAGIAGALSSAVALANAGCLIQSWANKDNLPRYGNGNVDFNTNCYPTDSSGNANTIANNATRCVNVWNAVLSPAPTATTAATGADFRATAASNVCTFRFLIDTTATRQISYNALTGTVTATNP